MKMKRAALFATAFLVLQGCGGGDGGSPPTPPSPPPPPPVATFSIGGSISGLPSGTSLELQNNAERLVVSAAGAFSFPTRLAGQSAYAVTVRTQPSGQNCAVQNGSGSVGTANISNVTITCAPLAGGGSGTLAPTGGTVSTPLADVTAPPNASLGPQAITVNATTVTTALPAGLTAVGSAVDVDLDHEESLNAPFLITLKYDAAGIADENSMAVVHYDAARQRFEPVTILEHDQTLNTMKIEARTFSPFQVVTFLNNALSSAHNVTGFSAANNGWNIGNSGSYFTSGGDCLGMSGYATWYFTHRTDRLFGKYADTGIPSIAQIVAMRTQLAQSQYWAAKSNTYLNSLGKATTATLMKMYLDTFDEPLILLLGVGNSAQHASVVYGYSGNTFTFYDVNKPNASQTITFDGTNWTTYDGYDNFTFVANPSLGRTEDFAQLTTEAEGGFTTSRDITVTAPTQAQTINAHSTRLTGTLSNSLNSAVQLLAYVKGVPQMLATAPGPFSATVPISQGANPIVLLAGVDIRQQSNWYRNSATRILSVNGTLPATTLLATLTWDQDNTDVDLYVTEPAPSNQTAWYGSHSTNNVLALDFDNTQGLGPEHTTLTTAGANPGRALPGAYVVKAHYYSDRGAGQPITGNVTIVVNEGKPDQVLKSKSFSISTSNSSNSTPGGAGPDWVTIGTVDLQNGTITLTP